MKRRLEWTSLGIGFALLACSANPDTPLYATDSVKEACANLHEACSKGDLGRCVSYADELDEYFLLRKCPGAVDALAKSGPPMTFLVALSCQPEVGKFSASHAWCEALLRRSEAAIRALAHLHPYRAWPILAWLSVAAEDGHLAYALIEATWDDGRVGSWVREFFSGQFLDSGAIDFPIAVVLRNRDRPGAFLQPLADTLNTYMSSDWVSATEAPFALGVLGDPRAESVLVKALLQKRSERLAVVAAFALGLLRELSPDARDILDQVSASHWSPLVRKASSLAKNRAGKAYQRLESQRKSILAQRDRPMVQLVAGLRRELDASLALRCDCRVAQSSETSVCSMGSRIRVNARWPRSRLRRLDVYASWSHLFKWPETLGVMRKTDTLSYGLFPGVVCTIQKVDGRWFATNPVDVPKEVKWAVLMDENTLVVRTTAGDVTIRDGEVLGVECCGEFRGCGQPREDDQDVIYESRGFAPSH